MPPKWAFMKKKGKFGKGKNGKGKGKGSAAVKKVIPPRPVETQSSCLDPALRQLDISSAPGVISSLGLDSWRCKLRGLEGLPLADVFASYMPRIDTAIEFNRRGTASPPQQSLAEAAQRVLDVLGQTATPALHVDALLEKLPSKDLPYKDGTEVVYIFRHTRLPFLKVGKFVIPPGGCVLDRFKNRELDRISHPSALNGQMKAELFELVAAVPFCYGRVELKMHNSPATKRIDSTEFHDACQLPALLQMLLECFERNLEIVKGNLQLLGLALPAAPVTPAKAPVAHPNLDLLRNIKIYNRMVVNLKWPTKHPSEASVKQYNIWAQETERALLPVDIANPGGSSSSAWVKSEKLVKVKKEIVEKPVKERGTLLKFGRLVQRRS